MLANVTINIRKKKRKTASIYIERDGTVSVYVPEHLSDEEVAALVEAKQYPICRNLAKWQLLNETKVEREAVNGESFLYRGRNHYLQFSDAVKGIELRDKHFLVEEGKRERLAELFKEFYRDRGKEYLPKRVTHFAAKMGLAPEEVSVLELKNRWASCSVKRPKLNFHWKVMMAPLTVIDYLIVHELAHLKFTKHDAPFWNEVDKVLPDYVKQKEWLKRYGASLGV
ncbi:M48 family metallopeptidase [Geoalkalibacter halelectricus]|uniref:M48 family metallopeptidase n=1 Tax=Geoalkalibacter halelectricus TaxID=2847045 RepID=A0ABY5ZLJ8_9BACT|nr:SprT family zinc-dependent metalloprotease [Geoalkalibacter halelectricus]MDO3377191.1 M48 family metallopeptidase [Geoalkalibacter halelectricus]UWZ79478.1 M48 family metallopeptidase [Geoalkalibacter halelectricus]